MPSLRPRLPLSFQLWLSPTCLPTSSGQWVSPLPASSPLLAHVSSLRLSSGHSGQVLILKHAACTSLSSPCLLVVDVSIWATSLVLVVRRSLCGLSFFFFSPGYTSLWDSKTPYRPASERVSWYLETSPPSRFHPQDGSPSLTLLSLFLCFIFSPASFPREWAAFLGAWCPPPAFRSCSVEVAQHSNDLLLNLWGRK